MTTPLILGTSKDFPDQSFVEPPVRQRPRNCCVKATFVLFCVGLMFGTVYQLQNHASLHWESTELNWKSQNSTFQIINHNWLKSYTNSANNIYQHFWYCDDLSSVQPECDWVVTQILDIPPNKLDKHIPGGKKIHIKTINENWNKHIDHWTDMIEACRYGLLMIFWTMGELRTPTYDVCIKN